MAMNEYRRHSVECLIAQAWLNLALFSMLGR
jgi:hypothetical protein